jgi:hypothetical protein
LKKEIAVEEWCEVKSSDGQTIGSYKLERGLVIVRARSGGERSAFEIAGVPARVLAESLLSAWAREE